MSVDTIERVNAYFKSAVADVLPVFTIYKNVNQDLPEWLRHLIALLIPCFLSM